MTTNCSSAQKKLFSFVSHKLDKKGMFLPTALRYVLVLFVMNVPHRPSFRKTGEHGNVSGDLLNVQIFVIKTIVYSLEMAKLKSSFVSMSVLFFSLRTRSRKRNPEWNCWR